MLLGSFFIIILCRFGNCGLGWCFILVIRLCLMVNLFGCVIVC